MVTWLAQKRRLVAMLILGWALLDLSVPSLCVAETNDNLSGQFQESQFCGLNASAVTSSPKISAAATQHTQPPQPETDCWCCCAHITPTPVFNVSMELVATVHDPVSRHNLVFATVSVPYHPPRS